MGESCAFPEEELIQAEETERAKVLDESKFGVFPGQWGRAMTAREKLEEMTAESQWEASSQSPLTTKVSTF